jgi:hypothetical protein
MLLRASNKAVTDEQMNIKKPRTSEVFTGHPRSLRIAFVPFILFLVIIVFFVVLFFIWLLSEENAGGVRATRRVSAKILWTLWRHAQ